MSHQLPVTLLESLGGLPGFDRAGFEEIHTSGNQLISIRLNPVKTNLFSMPDLIDGPVQWNTKGFYLKERPSFTFDPAFHAGTYYVQEASSMFLEVALQQSVDCSQPLKVLDLCAAPGGKSTLIQSVISAQSLLVSNEVIKTRVNILAENISKWGAANIIVTNNDPRDFKKLENYFDVIVVDAPCSGSGLFRKDPSAIEEWSEQNVNMCSMRQQRILEDILPALKDNGILIYSTCSYSKSENEDIVNWLIMEKHLSSVQLKLKESWGIVETSNGDGNAFGYRFYPNKVKGEGFFLAVVKKIASVDENTELGDKLITENNNQFRKIKSKSARLTPNEINTVSPYLKTPDSFFYIIQNEESIAIPLHLETDLAIIQSALYIKKAGIKLGKIIRNELIPDHELAVSSIVADDLPNVDVSLDLALTYLRKEEIKNVIGTVGWNLITYKKNPLGWIKIMQNRINNYYPKEWRILKN